MNDCGFFFLPVLRLSEVDLVRLCHSNGVVWGKAASEIPKNDCLALLCYFKLEVQKLASAECTNYV